jgi:hypothetical protein
MREKDKIVQFLSANKPKYDKMKKFIFKKAGRNKKDMEKGWHSDILVRIWKEEEY